MPSLVCGSARISPPLGIWRLRARIDLVHGVGFQVGVCAVPVSVACLLYPGMDLGKKGRAPDRSSLWASLPGDSLAQPWFSQGHPGELVWLSLDHDFQC